MTKEVVEKLLSSKNIEDVCIALVSIHRRYDNIDKFQEYLREHIPTGIFSRIEIYVGEFNIVFYDHLLLDVFDKDMEPTYVDVIRL